MIKKKKVCCCVMKSRWGHSQSSIFQGAEAVSLPAHQCWWGPSWSWSGAPGPSPARSAHAPTPGRWCVEHISGRSAPPLKNRKNCSMFGLFVLFFFLKFYIPYFFQEEKRWYWKIDKHSEQFIFKVNTRKTCNVCKLLLAIVGSVPCSSCARRPE